MRTTSRPISRRNLRSCAARWLVRDRAALLILICLLASCQSTKVVRVTRGHAHNDYMHARPLRDALDNGFCSIEADIFLVDGKLLVAHEREHVRADRTLQSL